ncbi:MAG: COX15/CtaA family protein [Actinomycetes bacterium]
MKRLIYTFLLVTQMGIVVTGGAVRLTGSGLGCPTWPQCTPGSYTPVPHQAQGQVHSWIEFGNRLLTFLLVIAIIAAIIGFFKWGRNRSDSKILGWLAAAQFLGLVAQIVVGGISVLTHLNPFAVSAHFLLSIVLIAASLSLRQRMLDVPRISLQPLTKTFGRAVLLISLLVINLGVLVTGSGPHAGDEMAKRYHLDPRTISWLHADSVIALISLTFGLWLLIKASEADGAKELASSKIGLFLAICLAQGFIGYTQYFTGVPEILVGAHLLGVTLVWSSIWSFAYSTKLLSREKITL